MKLREVALMRAAVSIVALLAMATPPASAREPARWDAAKDAEIRATVPVCLGEVDCSAKWEAAQLWLASNTDFKLQTITGVLLETYSPSGADREDVTLNTADVGRIFARVTREPQGDGSYRIVANIRCLAKARAILAQEKCLTQDQTLDFNRKVGAARAAAGSVSAGVGICPAKVAERLKLRGFSDQAIAEVCAE